MEENNSLSTTNHFKLSHSTDIESSSSKNIDIPPSLIDGINKLIKKSLSTASEQIPASNDLWSIKIKPQFDKGIKNGEFILQSGSLEIRNSKTGRFVGKASLENADIDKFVNKDSTTALSKLSTNIVSVAGQIQMAEVSRKLDLIQEKIDLITEFLWRDKITSLSAINSTIQEAIESLPSDYSLTRINDCILDLKKLSAFFENTLENLVSKKIPKKIHADFLDGLKLFKFKKIRKNDYNEKYTKDVENFINEFNYLIELYFQTLALIGTCYQLLNEFHHSSKYFSDIAAKDSYFKNLFSNKLAFLLNIKEINTSDILPNLENRNLPQSLVSEVHYNDEIFKEIQSMHKKLITQFENLQIEYTVDPSLLLEG